MVFAGLVAVVVVVVFSIDSRVSTSSCNSNIRGSIVVVVALSGWALEEQAARSVDIRTRQIQTAFDACVNGNGNPTKQPKDEYPRSTTLK